MRALRKSGTGTEPPRTQERRLPRTSGARAALCASLRVRVRDLTYRSAKGGCADARHLPDGLCSMHHKLLRTRQQPWSPFVRARCLSVSETELIYTFRGDMVRRGTPGFEFSKDAHRPSNFPALSKITHLHYPTTFSWIARQPIPHDPDTAFRPPWCVGAVAQASQFSPG